MPRRNEVEPRYILARSVDARLWKWIGQRVRVEPAYTDDSPGVTGFLQGFTRKGRDWSAIVAGQTVPLKPHHEIGDVAPSIDNLETGEVWTYGIAEHSEEWGAPPPPPPRRKRIGKPARRAND